MKKFDYAAAVFPEAGQPFNPPPSSALDVWASCDSDLFEKFVAEVRRLMEKAAPVRRWSAARTSNLRLLLCNFIQNEASQPGRPIRYYRTPRMYAGATAYRPAWVSGKVLPKIVDALTAAGLAHSRVGQWLVVGGSTMSLTAPTPTLIALWESHGIRADLIKPSSLRPLIKLTSRKVVATDGSGARTLVEPPEPASEHSAGYRALEENVRSINAHMSGFGSHIPDEGRVRDAEGGEAWALDGAVFKPVEGATARVDLRATQLYRVYNNVDPALYNLDQNGRFYGPWWQQIRSESRQLITIDGEATVELDYSSLHPRMIYHLKGLDRMDDLYQLPGLGGGGEEFDAAQLRKAVKVTWLRMINSNKRQLAAVRRAPRDEVVSNWGVHRGRIGR